MIKKKIEKIVDKKKKEEELRYFDKYSTLFHSAYRFLAKKKALMYGGTALNEILPASLKIYDAYTLPDIDVLSPEAEKLAKKMVSFYKKMGHEAASFTEALHPGTYKVYVDGVQIADITLCDTKTYEKLLPHSVQSKQWKIKIVPPQYIRMTLHKIMSQPNDAHRWDNFFERLKRFYKAYPIPNANTVASRLCHEREKSPNNTLTWVPNVYKTLSPETVYLGQDEIHQILNNKKSQQTPFPVVALINEDLMTNAKMLKEKIPELEISKVFPRDDFVPEHIIITFKNKPVVILFRPPTCIAFNEYKKKRVATINAMIDFLLAMSMSRYTHFKKDRFLMECLANDLSKLQQKGNSTKKLLKQIVVSCYGPTTGIITMRRERAKRIHRKKMVAGEVKS